ncbi:hypothetical protein D9Q98_008962 [Chlorella vulgaris]|uniref:Ion channel POLLUX n=1 Tax=Chlorella vulgaris TaxID=3077 RepID=A0A9D4TH15_CHLVU|nr:hypothetical protein D9Q98_008962 [Chlorella vulgaris]
MWRRMSNWSAELTGRLMYKYYNWRKDTLSDLQLFLLFNVGLFLLGAGIEGAILRGSDDMPDTTAAAAAAMAAAKSGDVTVEVEEAWLNLYSVFKTVFGQEMPGLDSSFIHQLFSVATVIGGLGSFALVLALVEQVVLEVLEVNVKVGSCVYEQGHTVLLCWCESAGETEQVTRMLKQLCLAYRASGGRTVVVLTQHGKLEMETAFRGRIPLEQRYGSTLVFRCGSPLDPAALSLVSCATAGSIIISGDYSRLPLESDDQVVRAAILVDEILLARQQQQQQQQGQQQGQQGWQGAGAAVGQAGKRPTMVAQVKGREALATLQFACGDRVHAIPTKSANARRLARMVQLPETAALLREFSNYGSHAHLTLRALPSHLAGKTVAELALHMPDAAVVGLQQANLGSGGNGSNSNSNSSSSSSSSGRNSVLVNPSAATIVRQGDQLVLLSGEHVTFLSTPLSTAVDPARSFPGAWGPASRRKGHGSGGGGGTEPVLEPSIVVGAGSMDDEEDLALTPLSSRMSELMPDVSGVTGVSALAASGSMDGSAPEEYRLPEQYYALSGSPQRLLVCGWGCQQTMAELLCALDSGPQSLPVGSSVMLVNHHPDCRKALDEIVRQGDIKNIFLRHTRADPRSRAALGAAVQVGDYTAAMILSDELWHRSSAASDISGTGSGTGGIPGGGGGPVTLEPGSGVDALAVGVEPSSSNRSLHEALRMDASVLGVQLNIRMLLQAAGCRDINLICEKQSHTGVTRFEDMNRLPLGVTFDAASFSARLLSQAAVEPLVWGVYGALGRSVHFFKVDASELAGEQEELSYCQLQQRTLISRQSVLLGFYTIPQRGGGVRLELNPQGEQARSQPRVWNSGDGRCKLLLLAPKAQGTGDAGAAEAAAHPAQAATAPSSV